MDNELKELQFDDLPELQFEPESKFGKFMSPMQETARKVTDYYFPQWMTDAKFERGQQNIYGDIFNRPSAAIRSALMGRGYVKGALTPEEVPTFQNEFLRKYYGEEKPSLVKTIGGFGVSAAGMGADILTNPADLLLLLSGKKIMEKGVEGLGKAGELISEKGTQLAKSRFSQFTARGVEKTIENIKTLPSRLPQIMGKNYTLQRAEKTAGLLDDARSYLGKLKGEAIKQYGDRIVDAQKLSSQLPSLPKNVLNALDDPIYAIEKLSDGSIKPSIANLDKIKEALGDFMTSKTWEEATTKNKQVIKQAYGLVSQAMKDAAPEIKEPIATYHDFMDIYRDVNKTIRNTEGVILEKRLRGVLKPGAERRYQIAWEQMQKYIPELKRIAKDIIKFNQRQTTKRILGRGALYLGGFEAGRRFIINPLLRSMGGEER